MMPKHLLDSHTSVGVKVARDFRTTKSSDNKNPMIIASTAHYAKFEFSSDEGCLPKYPEDHIGINKCKNNPVVHFERLEASLDAIIHYLKDFLLSAFP